MELDKLLKKNSEMIKIALPAMNIIYDILKNSGFSLYITDKNGIVLTILGDEEIIEGMAKTGIMVGSDMSEKSTGTNAIGTALHENSSVQISGEDHFISAYYIWTCSAAVIHNEDEEIIGCLNLTGRCQLAHPHTLGLVVAAVKSIEYQLKVKKTQKELINAYKYLNKVMDSINTGVFASDTNGKIKAINKCLCDMIGIKEVDVIGECSDNILNNWKFILEELIAGRDYENKEIIFKKQRFYLNVYPIRDTNEIIVGMVAIFKDMQNIYNIVNKYTNMSAVYTFDDLIGVSKEFTIAKEQAKRISNSPSTVLIQGESGTGKELFAQSIHNNSDRRDFSFIAINCGAIPKSLIESELFGYEEGAFTGAKKGVHPGKFELSNGGTLFLDEIGEMPLDMQVSLLRVIQEGCVTRLGGNKCINLDVRIIAATNKNLKDEVMKGTFREDLYYRISVIPIYIPPLRERKEDVEMLIRYFLKVKVNKLNKSIPSISYELYHKLIHYAWPGNVRELENCIENIVNMDGNTSFRFDSNPKENVQSNSTNTIEDYDMRSLDEWERRAILSCISKCNGNISEASKTLGINRSTLYSKMKKYNLRIEC